MENKQRINRPAIVISLLVLGILPQVDVCAKDIKLWHRTSVYQDLQGAALVQPEGVACAGESDFVAADSGHDRLLRLRFDSDFNLAESDEIKLPQLKKPTKIQLGRNGEMYVLNRTPLQIVRLSADGRFISVVKPAGSSTAAVKSFAVHPSGELLVIDPAAKHVLAFAPGGGLRAKIAFPPGAEFLSDITVDPKGRVLAVDAVAGIVYALDGAGRAFTALTESLKPYARYPSALTTDAAGRIFLTDRNGGRIVVVSTGGSFLGRLSARGNKDGLLHYPSQVCINAGRQLSVADTLNNRLQVFQVSD